MAEPTVLLLSTSDTDLISARSSGKNYRWANPARLSEVELPDLLAGASIVVVRILGGYRAWEDGIDAVVASGIPAVVVSGEQAADAELIGRSTVPAGIAVQAHIYLAQGGVDNLRSAARIPVRHPADDRLRIHPARLDPDLGRAGPAGIAVTPARRSRCSITARSNWPETPPTSRRCARRSRRPAARPLPVYCASLRTAEPELLETARRRRRHGGHRAGRRGSQAGQRRRPAATTTAGTSNTLRPWISRSCRACA